MRKVAVTGGIASGKSTLCCILEEQGAYLLNADHIIHQLLKGDLSIKKGVIDLLGEAVIREGEIDRQAVAESVFSEKKKLKALEKLLHPKLFLAIEKHLSCAKKRLFPLFVIEFPLVQELKKEREFDLVIAVYADEARAKERFMKKGFSASAYEQRMSHQWTPQKKAARADRVIENNSSKAALIEKVMKLIKEINPQ